MKYETLTGVPIADIAKKIGQPFPAKDKRKIKFGPMVGKDSIDPAAIHARLDDIFGLHGIGWKIVGVPGLSGTDIWVETRRNSKGEEVTWYVVDLTNYVFQYALVDEAGNVSFAELSTLSDSDANMERGYAFRGAFTSLMKHAYKVLGGDQYLTDEEEDDGRPTPPPQRQQQSRPADKPPATPPLPAGDKWDKAKADVFMRRWRADSGVKALWESKFHGRYSTVDALILSVLGVMRLSEVESEAEANLEMKSWIASGGEEKA